jgi:hypothetical protein
METTLFLAKVFGLYLLAMGLLMALRRKDLSATVEALADNRPLVFLVGVLVLILGLVLVVSHNVWIAGWPLVVTVLSWLVLTKALAYLLLPFEVTARLVRRLNRPAWFVMGGALWAALGFFLAGKGFGLF